MTRSRRARSKPDWLPSADDPNLWIAVLREIEASGGNAKPQDVYPKLRAYFPTISDSEAAENYSKSGKNKWTNRIQFARERLVKQGCIDKSEHGVWSITAAGRGWLKQTWQGMDADYSTVAKPSKLGQGGEPPRPKATGQLGLVETNQVGLVPQPIRGKTKAPPMDQPAPVNGDVVVDAAEQLCTRLVASQRNSIDSKKFERDICDAFSFLGFESVHIGGPSEADIVLTAPLGQLAYSVIVDAKSSQSGRIGDGQINWPVIESYQKNHGATFAVVVGEKFAGGQLVTFADKYQVTLVTTSVLLDVVRMHAKTPLNLLDLKSLFSRPGPI